LSWLQEKKTRGEKFKPAGGGAAVCKEIGLGLGFGFFLYFSDVSKLPPLMFELWTSIYR